MYTLLFIVLAIAFLGGLIWLFSIYWRYAIDKNVMVHFRVAEALTEEHQLPNEWIAEVKRRRTSPLTTWFGLRKVSGVDLLLQKIDTTIVFFEKGGFYADDNAKKVLLAQLAQERERIESMSWEQILLEQNRIHDLTI